PPGGDATPEQYKALIVELNRLGWRHSPHTATNEALEAVLQAYEAADRESPIRDKRWVVEHIPHVTPPQMERLAKLGVIVSTNMVGYAGNYDAAVRTLGREQAERQTPVREMLDHKIVVVNGSDYGRPDPGTESGDDNVQQPVRPAVFLRVAQDPRRTRARTAREDQPRGGAAHRHQQQCVRDLGRAGEGFHRTRKAR